MPASMLFFFQADDGIRDPLVTGVQTCALPIYGDAEGSHQHPPDAVRQPGDAAADLAVSLRGAVGPGRLAARSEERRVGKECRSRWWRHHEKKKSRVTLW